MKFNFILTFIVLFSTFPIKAATFSTVWLNNRYFYIQSCRQHGMAGGGYSFPNDESLLFINPAGLGIRNKKFNNLAFSYGNTFESHQDWSYLIHDHYLSSCFQPFKNYVGGLSLLIDFNSITQNMHFLQTQYDPISGQIVPIFDTLSDKQFNILGIVGYGRDLSFISLNSHSIGVSAILNSIYHSNFGDPAIINSLHLNAGYTGCFSDFFHLGLVFINIPIVKSFNSNVNAVTPFAISPSFGFSPVFVKKRDIDAFKMFTEFNYKFTIEKHENIVEVVDTMGNVVATFLEDTKLIKTHFYTHGYEFGINDILFLRNGYSWIFDNEVELNLFEVAGGFGVNNRKHFEFNFYLSVLFYNYDYIEIDPAKRFGLSISFYNIGNN